MRSISFLAFPCQKSSHNLPSRYSIYKKDLEEIYERTASIDNILLAYLREVAARRKYPPLVFRICRYILSLGKKYGLGRIVAACAYASEGNLYEYNEIKDIQEQESGDDVRFMVSEDGTIG